MNKRILICLTSITRILTGVNVFSQQVDNGKLNIEYTDSGESDNKEDYEIVVTGTRSKKRLRDSPVITEVIRKEEINNSTSDSLEDILEDYGLQFAKNAMGSYIRLQGMGGSKILFLVNGRKLVGRVAQRLDADTISTGNIERIEIVRGPQSALYGSEGIGGVINIITQKPSGDFSGRVKIINSFVDPSDDDDYFRQQKVNASIDIPMGPVYSHFYTNLRRSDFLINEDSGMSVLPEEKNVNAGADFDILASDKIDISTGGNWSFQREDDQVNSDGGLERKDTTRANGYIAADFDLTDSLSFSSNIYHNYYLRDRDKYLGLSDKWEGQDYKEEENFTCASLFADLKINSNNLLTAGIEYSRDSLYKYNLDGDGATKVMHRQAFVIQDEQFSKNHYSVMAGLRLENGSKYGFFAAPKISAMYYLCREFRITAGTGIGYRAPEFSDLYLLKDSAGHPVIEGNENLDPEKSLGTNIGFELSTKKIYAMANLFHNELRDEIINVIQPYKNNGRDVYIKKNIGDTYRQGADLEAGIKLPLNLSVSGGYNFIYGYSRSDNETLKDQPMHTMRAKISYNSPGKNFLTYFSCRYLTSADDLETGDVFMADFYISGKLFNHIRLFAGVDNITDKTDHSSGNLSGRVFSAGAEGWF